MPEHDVRDKSNQSSFRILHVHHDAVRVFKLENSLSAGFTLFWHALSFRLGWRVWLGFFLGLVGLAFVGEAFQFIIQAVFGRQE